MNNSNAPMTNADWLRAYAGWVDGKQFDMLDARYFEESADELESLRADNDRLREALKATQLTLGFLKSVVRSAEPWSDTCDEQYSKTCRLIDTALAKGASS